MGFGITYELVITLFVVLFGLLLIVLHYTHLAPLFVQLSFLFGFFILLSGWMRKDYDLFYTGILLMIIPLVLVSAMGSVGISKSTAEAALIYAISPLIYLFNSLYSLHPIIFVMIIFIIAYALSKK